METAITRRFKAEATPPAEPDQPRRAGHARRVGTASPGGAAPSRISGSHPGGRARTATSGPPGSQRAAMLRSSRREQPHPQRGGRQASRTGPRVSRQLQRARTAFRDRQQVATPGRAGRIPPLPRDAGGSGHRQAHTRAIDAAGQLAGSPPPSGDATIGAFRRGDRRVKHAVRGPVRPMLRGEIPAPPGARGDGRRSRQRLSPVESARARAAAGRHLALLSEATARCVGCDGLNDSS